MYWAFGCGSPPFARNAPVAPCISHGANLKVPLKRSSHVSGILGFGLIVVAADVDSMYTVIKYSRSPVGRMAVINNGLSTFHNCLHA